MFFSTLLANDVSMLGVLSEAMAILLFSAHKQTVLWLDSYSNIWHHFLEHSFDIALESAPHKLYWV